MSCVKDAEFTANSLDERVDLHFFDGKAVW
jgi:hypothetical protein